MKTPIQEAIEKLTRYEPGHEPGLMEADQRGDYLHFIDVMEALAQAKQLGADADGLPPLPEIGSLVPEEMRRDIHKMMRAYALADRAARQSAAPGEVNWLICERIGNEDHVDEALRAFSEDSTQDNATGVIQAALTVYLADTAATAAPAPSEPVAKVMQAIMDAPKNIAARATLTPKGNMAPYEPVPQGVPNDYHDAYRGARDDLQDWKNRALKAESRLNTLVAEINAESGPTFMGEPVAPTSVTATTDKLPTIAGEAEKIRVFNGASAEWKDRPTPKNETDFLLSSPANAAHLEASIGQLGSTKSPDANIEKNRELLLQRSIVGLAKYGVTTVDSPIPHKEWLQHALEESLDMANYLQAAINRPEPAMELCREMVKRWDDRDNLSDDDYDAEGLRIESAIRDLINKEGKQ